MTSFDTYDVKNEKYKFEMETRPIEMTAVVEKGLVQTVGCSEDIGHQESFAEWVGEQNESIEFVELTDLYLGDPLELTKLLYEGTIFQWYLWQKMNYPMAHAVLDFPTPHILINYRPAGRDQQGTARPQYEEWEGENAEALDKLGKQWLGPLGSKYEVMRLVKAVLEDALKIKFQLTLEQLLLTPRDGIYLKRA